MSNFDELLNEPILYELLEYFIRKQEPELIKCKTDTAILPTSGTIKNALRYLNNRYSLPESISQQIGLTLPWKFAVGDSGRLLAVLQENVIEIRKAKDEYSSVVGKASVPKDAFPQWRKLVWSPDGTILVLASSNGCISFYNSLGNNIFNIIPKTVSQNPHVLEAGDAIASMIFLNPRVKIDEWTYEFMAITYSGLLKSYNISISNGYTPNYEFSFGNFYRNGINAVSYVAKNDLFYVAGNTIMQKLTSSAAENGLTSWRRLNDYPYFKLSFAFDKNDNSASTFFIWNIIPTFKFHAESIIFKTKVSPNSNHLVCLHTDGSVSLWSLPNLILRNKWKLNEQPDFNTPNPLRLTRCKKFPPGFTEFHPIDIGWWSEQAIIITRYSGSTSVCSIKDLKNLLGTSPEFLAGQPQISELDQNCGFLCLDCEMFITSKKRSRDFSGEGQTSEISSESEKEDDELEPVTIFNYTTNLVQSTLYSITDIERFQPKRKKSKVLYRTYRILALKSTTPEELYSRKIEIEEYEEALALANTYNLDTDLVYQTQWRKSELSLNAIQEHLSKVTKRSWVLNECITRVPDTIEAARELLNFGLKGANLETLIAIGTCDDGKFVVDSIDETWEDIDETTICLRQVQKVNNMLDKINIENLSEAQKDLIKYRRQLLDHLDKLLTYEIILELPLKYNKEFYEEFRRLSAIENAIKFAKDSDCRAVEIMFTYYGDKLLPHWLAIINFFPETLNPLNYEKLLPKCDSDRQLFLLDQRELRQKDWSEKNEFNNVITCDDDDPSQQFYDTDPSLSTYRNTPLTPELLQQWYKSRAYQIERNSFMIDNALQLIRIAKSHNIMGLEELLIDLETLDDLVYNVCMEDMCLDRLEKLSNLEKIKLLMSTCNEENFVRNIKNLLLPFIKRRHRYLGGEVQRHYLSDYLINLSGEDLKLPMKFFEYIKHSSDAEITDMIEDVVSLAIDCIYACNNSDAIHSVKSILDSIPKDHSGNRRNSTYNLLEELERELECVKILNKYDVKATLNYIRKNKNNTDDIKFLLNQMARSLNTIVPSPGEKQWAQLLNDMLEIHGLVFSCIDIEICFEICVSTRLVSGVKSNIQKCSALIETKKSEQSLLKVSYEKAVNLILEASKEYFNSSKSLTDTNMELAKACLRLIEDDNVKIKEEYELIKSLQILNEFNIDMLPFQIRQMNDRLKLIQHCLDMHGEAYKSRQRLLTLASYLRIESSDSRVREGKVLELVAKKSLELQDYDVCATVCQQLMQSNYIPAWKIILNLGYCENFQDFKFRQKCLWFAINNGPNEILSEALEHMHLIEIQSLHKSLELWMPSDEMDYLDTNETESDDEFTDAMTTPQIERKEFVPKMLEASTEIVKTSANVMKESFGLIKSISDTDFWKSRLNLNFVNSSTEHSELENNETEKRTDIQSFPCFYASLHETCNISNLDIKYDKYSMPTIENPKLKCCQALLRIAILSESSCYGLEVSDISHLLLECAKYTITEDWLLGMAYLLSLNKDFTKEVKEIFESLPKNDLFIQTAAYYYSFRLYVKSFKNTEKIYLYDPISLIYKMLSVVETLEESDLQKALLEFQPYFFSESKTERTSLLELKNSTECKAEDHENICNTENTVEETEHDVIKDEKKIITVDPTLEASLQEPDHQEVDWTDDWGDFSEEDNLENSESNENIPRSSLYITNGHMLFKEAAKCNTEEDCFELFNKISNEVNLEDHYEEIKRIVLQWPKFTKPEFTTVDAHPVLMLMKVVPIYSAKKHGDSSDQIYQEYKNLVEYFDSTETLTEFLHNENERISTVHSLYIKLCTNNPELQAQVVDFIREKYETISLPAPVLEELFLKNLTASFPASHPVYNRIIQHVFVDQSLTNIEENARILVNKLMEQKDLGQALSLISLIENVPPFLRTFSNCFELLMKK